MANYINSTLEDVKFHIATQDFDGPIDLLVKFVKESKIDIMDIFLSDITSQYVNYVKSLNELNYEYVSQYVIFAALLIEIKSAKMAPKPVMPYYDDDDSYADYSNDYLEKESAILEEVKKKLLKEYPEKLKPMEVINVFYPEPKYDESDYKLVAKNLTLDKLVDAYKLVLENAEIVQKAPPIQTIIKDRFTVTEKVVDISKTIREKKRVSFFDLFEKDYTKRELLTIFLAILEIIRKQIAIAAQDGYEQDIILAYNSEADKETDEKELLKDVDEYN